MTTGPGEATKMMSPDAFLILGGTTKAATTALYAYLRDHPGVAASTSKETRFFLDPNYPVPSKYRLADGLDCYMEYFQHAHPGQVRLDATPDYLYCPVAAEAIQAVLPAARMVFSLRDPISRVQSWYRFARQAGRIPAATSLASFIEQQVLSPGAETPQYARAMEQGRYARYLQHYYALFGPARIHVVFYEDLATAPRRVMEGICEFAGLDPEFYRDYAFEVVNASQAMRSPRFHRLYMQVRYHIRNFTHHHQLVHGALRGLKRALEPVYLRVNARREAGVGIPPELRRHLSAFYREDRAALERLIQRAAPWHDPEES